MDEDPMVTTERRPSIEKTPVRFSPDLDAFHQLPDEIIEQILLATDPDGFASLILLNSKWRAISQRPYLYVHHLAQCPLYAISHTEVPIADDENLPLLRQLFSREVKRNLFAAYLRPKQTLVKLVSTSISSSSCPGGEGMQFASSQNGQHILAYNSSRLHVINVRGPVVEVTREFKIQRRPVSACITDDANTLAVLSNEMQVDVYSLLDSPPERKQSLIFDKSPTAIAISACGAILAAAYDGGIEVSALSPSAAPTETRAVKCDSVDSLAFSRDGRQILGTTVHSSPPSTIVLTAPYYDPGSQVPDDNLDAMWTTSILFPNTSRDCSHAIFLPDGQHGEPEWTLTYDRSFETFRAVRLDDLRNGTTYFTGPLPNASSQSKLLPCTVPAATCHGELISAGFQGKDVWVYGVPGDLDAVPEPPPSSRDSSNSPGLGRHSSVHSSLSRRTSVRAHDGESERVPQWQILCDKLRNNLVSGSKVAEINGVSSVKWVEDFGDSSSQERLLVTATGVKGPRLVTDEEDLDFVDGGRIALLDFDYGTHDGEATEITIELGTGEAEPLQEEHRDLETEVAIVRRRTVAQRRGGTSGTLLRAATTANAQTLFSSTQPDVDDSGENDDDDPLVPRTVGQNPANNRGSKGDRSPDEEFASIEEQEAMDAPYAHSSPRSQTTLRRAATAAAANRRLNPRTADGRPIEYRRADGRAEHPHESDADNWVPPPPPYQKEDPGDLPAFLRGQAVAPPLVESTIQATPLEQSVQVDREGRINKRAHQRTASDPASPHRLRTDDAPAPRPSSSPPAEPVEDDDIYDASPERSPVVPTSHPIGSDLQQTQSSLTFNSQGAALSTMPVEATSSHRVTEMSTKTLPDSPPSASSNTSPRIKSRGPVLDLQIPTSPSLVTRSATEAEPAFKRLPNSHTWPRHADPETEPASSDAAQSTTGYPRTAPPTDATSNDLATKALPPAPSSSQVDSLNKRISQGNPRRLSGNILNAKVWQMDQAHGVAKPTMQQRGGSAPREEEPRPQATDGERPLIISTPTGISGAFDPPDSRVSDTRIETPILAPVPRRPGAVVSRPIPAAQQLQDIYGNQPAPAPLPAHIRCNQNALPMWMRTPSNSSRRTPTGVNRRRSRAERSAVKNMKDAKKRRWMAKSKKSQEPDADSASWVDVDVSSKPKPNKCVIM